jgi:hypothetical protein
VTVPFLTLQIISIKLMLNEVNERCLLNRHIYRHLVHCANYIILVNIGLNDIELAMHKGGQSK